MADVLILALAALLFAVCLLYVRWCDAIIGPDADLEAASEASV